MIKNQGQKLSIRDTFKTKLSQTSETLPKMYKIKNYKQKRALHKIHPRTTSAQTTDNSFVQVYEHL